MNTLKAKFESAIGFPAEVLRSVVVNAGLTQAKQLLGAGEGRDLHNWFLENELAIAPQEPAQFIDNSAVRAG